MEIHWIDKKELLIFLFWQFTLLKIGGGGMF